MLSAKRFLGLTTLLFLFSLVFATAAVEFSVESSNANPRVGDSFNLLVKLNVPAADEIKSAEFTLTPGAGVTLQRGISGNLLGGAPSLNVIVGNALQYAEGTTGAAVSGNARLLVTIPVTAAAAGDVTFTFSALKAAKGRASRGTSSTPLTITIAAAGGPPDPCAGITCQNGGSCAAGACNCVGGYGGDRCQDAPVVCTPLAPTPCAAGVACPGNTPVAATGCPANQHCDASNNCVADAPACVARGPTYCIAGLQCPENVAIPPLGCLGGRSCDAANNCVANAPPPPPPPPAPATKKAQLKQAIEDIPDVPEDNNWTIGLINRIAQILRGLFPN